MSATSPDTGQQAALNGAAAREVSTAAASVAASPNSGAAAAAAAGPGARRHRDGTAHDRARRDHRERRPAAHPDRARLLRHQPGMGRQRVRAGVRRAAAARRKVRRPTGASPGLHRRHPGVLAGLAARRVRHQPGVAAHRARPAGRRRRVRRAHGAVADRRHLPRGPAAQPRDGRVRRDEHRRRRGRPARQRAAAHLRQLALGVLRERADRPRGRAAGAAGARRVRTAAGSVRPAGRDHRLARPGRRWSTGCPAPRPPRTACRTGATPR